MNKSNFNTKTYYTILNQKYPFKKELINQLPKLDKFKFYKKDLAILFIVDHDNYKEEIYNNQETRYIDSFINEYINDELNEIELTKDELRELMLFSEEKRLSDDMNLKIIEKYVELYNKYNKDKLDINDIKKEL